MASHGQFADIPKCFTASVDLHGDTLSRTAAALSYAVYDNEWLAAGCRSSQQMSAIIENRLQKAVVLYECDTGARHKVEAGARFTVDLEGLDKALVHVYATPWTWVLWDHLCLCKGQPIWGGYVYEIARDFRGKVVLEDVTLPAVDILHTTQKASSRSPVQWLLARSGTVLYLSFRGTEDFEDLAINLAAVPDYCRFQEYGIGVHSGIAHALEQDGEAVDTVVSNVVDVLKLHRGDDEQLVLCGHSLGAGYAQVMAVHLLSRKASFSAVRTFGAPHVLVPPRSSASPQLWQQLHAVTQHWAHGWDPVPKLPLCSNWLGEVLPKLKQELIEGIRVGIAQRYTEGLQRNYQQARAHFHFLQQYDVAGEVVLVCLRSGIAHRRGDDAAPVKELLAEKPPESVMTLSKLRAYHSMSDYYRIARQLTAA